MMELDKIKLTEITPAGYNPRLISEEDYGRLKNSIEHFGLVDPIIINLKNNRIIGGHQRYDVLLDEYNLNGDYEELDLLKLGDIGLVFLDTELKMDSEDREKALNLALNKISGGWDNTKLNTIFDDLNSKGFDLDLTGFNNIEITQLSLEEDINYESFDSVETLDDIYDDDLNKETGEIKPPSSRNNQENNNTTNSNDNVENVFELIITCTSEEELQELYNKFTDEGYNCRSLIL